MKTLYLDLLSGISGDMFVGALLDLGVGLDTLEEGLRKLGVGGYHLHADTARRGAFAGTKFEVHLTGAAASEAADERPPHHDHEGAHNPSHTQPRLEAHGAEHHHGHNPPLPERDYAAIRQLIEASGLSAWVRTKALAVFERIAVAEAKVHGVPVERVHFHEVGALDSLVDIVGACVALESLGQPRVLASAVTEGTGWLRCQHGLLPLPAPATLEILSARGVTLTQCEEPHELVTPTGAALLAEFVETFGPMRDLPATRVGYGLGQRENRTRPNVLRVVLGEITPTPPALDWETDTVAVLETNVDNFSAEILGHVAEQMMAGGALDVFFTPAQMKKHRPGVLLTVLCAVAEADRFTEWMLRETSALGVRRSLAERRKLRRSFQQVTTAFGEVPVKLGLLNGRVVQAAPEYENCRQLALAAGVPLKQVYAAAMEAVGTAKNQGS